MALYTRTFIQEAQPTPAAQQVQVGDLWLQPSLRKLEVCAQIDPVVLFVEVTRGDAPTVAVTDITTANADATYGQPEADLINEVKADLNILLAALRGKGIVS